MRLFNGAKAADKILRELKTAIGNEGLRPKLAVILVGEDEASKIYIRLKRKAAEGAGVGFELYKYDMAADSNEVMGKIKELNAEKGVSGIIVQLPLPDGWDRDKIIRTINPRKDVDGFHEENRHLLIVGRPDFEPVLPMAILAAAQEASESNLVGKKAVALVNSDVFGLVLKIIFQKEGVDFDYVVRDVCSATGLKDRLGEADIVITVCGCPGLITGEMIKEGAALIDGGIYRFSDGRVRGDVDLDTVKNRASFLTPVPGGLGPLVIALLLKNVYLAEKAKNGK